MYGLEQNITTVVEILVSQDSWVDHREPGWIRVDHNYSPYNKLLTEFWWADGGIKKTETRMSNVEDGFGNSEVELQYVYNIKFIDETEVI